MLKKIFVICTFFFLNLISAQPPGGFVYLSDLIPDIEVELRYFGDHNFTGRPVPGYEERKVILTTEAAKALAEVQQELENDGYCLKIFDGYRPQTAVNSFIEWAKNSDDTLTKAEFYPEKKKRNLFNLGYIATKSGHSRGSTVDLTIVDANTLKEIDMGGTYDYFGERSHHNFTNITKEQKANRNYLKSIMHKHGFRPYSEEWWHYTLRNEPFPNTYFDFTIK
ncbi:M15 family metallopeptidase [Zunongwangia sp. SCSIO 43204]|uniref:M15 family metallopeptidase n=1 Tax=Zunongwangia sp. SCSIO 43204 TaxID=2779359 RepID=UPI001CA9E26B|nr:M15 family metallopeptidase [Zunongwangia sp. SCSIO 43204]UAB85913.1 M15 family metallopeptidase [Zunongwangia sp. SCSIO 43204]